MDAKLVNALLAAVVSTFKQVIRVEPKIGKPRVIKEMEPKYSLVTVLGFVGDIEGNVVYSFTTETGIKIVSQMMGMPYDKLDELALSALGELGNMTTGALAVNLEKVGYKVDITPPTVITGKEIKVTVDGTILNLPMNMFSEDDIELNLIVKK